MCITSHHGGRCWLAADKQHLRRNAYLDFTTMLPANLLLLVQVFCIICPVITPVACFYFAMQYLVW